MTTLEKTLHQRAGSQCEICGNADTNLVAYSIPSSPSDGLEAHILLCESHARQLTGEDELQPAQWRTLSDSIWSEVDAVKVVSYRTLHRLHHAGESWARDLLEMSYLDDDVQAWADRGLPDENAIVHVDANGHVLQAGDTVVLIKDLSVKGSSLVAKRGTAVRRIRLDPHNPKYIEGKVNGQQIVLVTDYVKKK